MYLFVYFDWNNNDTKVMHNLCLFVKLAQQKISKDFDSELLYISHGKSYGREKMVWQDGQRR